MSVKGGLDNNQITINPTTYQSQRGGNPTLSYNLFMEIVVGILFIFMWGFHSEITKQRDRIDELEDKLKRITGETKEYDEFGPLGDD